MGCNGIKQRPSFVAQMQRAVIALSLLALIIELHPASARARSSADAGALHAVEIVTKAGSQVFLVEVAKTPEQRARGLMFRKQLSARRGMLFNFGRDQEIRMWMKDTLVPLDMIFIESDGRIRRIEQNAAPKSLRVISSGGPARAVLEVKAGTARKFGISIGDRVTNLFTDQ